MKSSHIILLLLISLYSCANPVFKNEIIHTNAELGKVCPTSTGDNLIISKSVGRDITLMSKLDSNANYIYHNKEINLAYSGNAQIMESKLTNGEDGYTLYHKAGGKEYFTELKDQGIKGDFKKFDTYHEQASSLTLKNGKIFFVGITKPSDDFVRTVINLRIYDPQANIELQGESIVAYSKYVSCYEQAENDVYCVYVYDEDPLRSLLGIQNFKVTDAGIAQKSQPYLIKAFYTQFNYVQTMKYNEKEVGIFFQTGDPDYIGDIPYGNTGKDLYYYHLEVTPTSMKVVRYDYISTNCRFSSNSEDYTADMIAVEDTVYLICEVENEGKDFAKAFKGYVITKGVKKIGYIDYNRFDGKGVKNPQFVKFDKTLAILYTHILSNDGKNVNLLLMNYPDCQDVEGNVNFYGVCPAGNQSKLLSQKINVFLNNPYPISMQNEKVYFRFLDFNNMVIYNGNTPLELNKDYDPSVINDLSIKEYNNAEGSFLEYVATRKDSKLGVIIGKTCKVRVENPQCLDQCNGCDAKGTTDDHHCFDCKPGFWYDKKYKDTSGCGLNEGIYNCPPCDIACEQCYGPFDNNVPTTNCKENFCNTDDGYYPFEDNYRTCFNESDKEKWEELLNLKEVLFLDKNNSTNKKEWVWRKCHERCASCSAKGDNKNNKCDTCKSTFFFYCNQTKDNGGIPGSCHDSCENNGCYKSDPKDTENMEKMCPCLENCKACKNKDLCDECWRTWLLPPERTSCNKTCDYCLTPYFEIPATQEKGRCINCREEFNPPQYTFNNKCYEKAKIPRFNYTAYGKENLTYTVEKLYHVIDPKCNMLTGCKKGCNKCSVLETDRCTECEEDYYMEDPFNITKRSFFKCFTKKECLGLDQYPNDPEFKAGGVAIEENEQKVCLNCKQRNNSYRLPEEDFYCGEKINRTFVDIPGYNKLSYCYVRCKECDKWGTSCVMNCLSCRDSKYYDLIRYEKRYGNCFRKQHKCGIYPYYHNYDLATDEDNCGEDCDVCLYNFQCPKEFPYFKYETHECVEFCPVTDVLGGACNVNNSAAVIILMKNPFGLRSPYDLLNNTITVNQIISSSLFQYFCSSYNCDVNSLSKDINNYLGHGQVYNLPESKIIVGNNISIELTSVKLELEKLAKYLKGDEDTSDSETPKTTAVDLSECEAILKKKYGLPEEEELIIVKADIMKELNLSAILPEFPDVQYQMFSTSLGAFLPLSVCQEENTGVTVSNPFSSYNLLNLFQSKTASVVSNGYDVFDAYSPFYNDICTPFTNENGNDVLLDARRKDYYNENVNLCDSGCTFVGYNAQGKTYTCRCNVQGTPGESTGEYKGDIVERTMPDNFKDLISRRSNIAVFKCASQAFSAEGQKNNFGSYILLAAMASFIGVAIFHFIKERQGMKNAFDKLGTIANPPTKVNKKEDKKEDKKENKKENKKDKKTELKQKKEEHNNNKQGKVGISENPFIDGPTSGKGMKNAKKHKSHKVKGDATFEDDELNYFTFEKAIEEDKRSFLMTYWSLLKFKQIIIFTFYTNSRGILRSTKISLFILFVGFYMAFTALFFNDEIMRAIYIYKGNTNAAVHIPNIILSSICSFIASMIVRFVCLGERGISKIITETDIDKRKGLAEKERLCANIKLYVLYIASGCLLFLCWYYVAAFGAVFKNSQKNYLINTLVSFIVCNLWPALTTLISTFMRRKALEKKNKTLYCVSQYIF